jgi:hypothetical protein
MNHHTPLPPHHASPLRLVMNQHLTRSESQHPLSVREMGGAPRKPAPRKSLVRVDCRTAKAATSQMHSADETLVQCRPPLRSTSPFSHSAVLPRGWIFYMGGLLSWQFTWQQNARMFGECLHVAQCMEKTYDLNMCSTCLAKMLPRS